MVRKKSARGIGKKGQADVITATPAKNRRKPVIIGIIFLAIIIILVFFLFIGKLNLGSQQFAGQAVASKSKYQELAPPSKATLEQKVTTLEKDVKTQTQKTSSLSSRVGTTESQISTITTDITKHGQKLADLETKIPADTSAYLTAGSQTIVSIKQRLSAVEGSSSGGTSSSASASSATGTSTGLGYDGCPSGTTASQCIDSLNMYCFGSNMLLRCPSGEDQKCVGDFPRASCGRSCANIFPSKPNQELGRSLGTSKGNPLYYAANGRIPGPGYLESTGFSASEENRKIFLDDYPNNNPRLVKRIVGYIFLDGERHYFWSAPLPTFTERDRRDLDASVPLNLKILEPCQDRTCPEGIPIGDSRIPSNEPFTLHKRDGTTAEFRYRGTTIRSLATFEGSAPEDRIISFQDADERGIDVEVYVAATPRPEDVPQSTPEDLFIASTRYADINGNNFPVDFVGNCHNRLT